MVTERRQARILAMQALCQWEVQRDESSELLSDFVSSGEAPPAVSRYATELVESFWKQHESVDDCIAAATEKWEFARISAVERGIMRVAVVELLGGKVPPKVALNEAIEIGREFGGKDSPRFINGVLDKIVNSLPSTERDHG